MQRPTASQDKPATGLVQTFLSSLKDLHVEGRVAKSPGETTEAIRAILAKAQCTSAVVAGIPARYAGAVSSALDGLKVQVVEEIQGRPPSEVVGTLASADLGVTWAAHGLATEGALLEVVFDDSYKLASSLPIVHVALLETASILKDLSEALPLVGEIVARSRPERKPIISFISGPSKTGDIEMRLLYGVHGPHSVYVVILDWS